MTQPALALAACILVCLSPFISFAAANKRQYVVLADLALYAAAFTAAALALVVIVRMVTRAPVARVAITVGCAAFLFLSFDQFGGPARSLVVSGTAWIAVVIAVSLVAWRAARHPRAAALFLVAGLAMAAPPAVEYGVFAMREAGAPAADPGAEIRLVRRPNVYFFVLDGYLRSDLQAAFLRQDDSRFTEALAERGFRVVTRASANYPLTWLSVGSTMSLGYIQQESDPPYPTVAAFHEIMRGRNRVVDTFRQNGYRYIHVASGHQGSNCSGSEDVCIENRRNRVAVDELELTLLRKTPILPLIERFQPSLLQRAAQQTWTQIADVADPISTVQEAAPFFLYAHFLTPHPPYLWTANCEPLSATGGLNINSWSQASIPLYGEAVQCVQAQIVGILDRIIARDPNVLVVIQSDHGSSFFVDWKAPIDRWSDKAVLERLSPLNALRLPADCRSTVYDEMSLVNTMRLVFACLSERPVEFLSDRWFVSPDSDHPAFGRVHEVHALPVVSSITSSDMP